MGEENRFDCSAVDTVVCDILCIHDGLSDLSKQGEIVSREKAELCYLVVEMILASRTTADVRFGRSTVHRLKDRELQCSSRLRYICRISG